MDVMLHLNAVPEVDDADANRDQRNVTREPAAGGVGPCGARCGKRMDLASALLSDNCGWRMDLASAHTAIDSSGRL